MSESDTMEKIINYLNDLYQSKILLEHLFVLFVLYEFFVLFIFIKIYLNTMSINNIVKEKKVNMIINILQLITNYLNLRFNVILKFQKNDKKRHECYIYHNNEPIKKIKLE
jgi:hypothetical protein